MQVSLAKLVLYQVVPTDDDLLIPAGLPGQHDGLFVVIVLQQLAYSVGDVERILRESQFFLGLPSQPLHTLRLDGLLAIS